MGRPDRTIVWAGFWVLPATVLGVAMARAARHGMEGVLIVFGNNPGRDSDGLVTAFPRTVPVMTDLMPFLYSRLN